MGETIARDRCIVLSNLLLDQLMSSPPRSGVEWNLFSKTWNLFSKNFYYYFSSTSKFTFSQWKVFKKMGHKKRVGSPERLGVAAPSQCRQGRSGACHGASAHWAALDGCSPSCFSGPAGRPAAGCCDTRRTGRWQEGEPPPTETTDPPAGPPHTHRRSRALHSRVGQSRSDLQVSSQRPAFFRFPMEPQFCGPRPQLEMLTLVLSRYSHKSFFFLTCQ